MRIFLFSKRNIKEILRDPINLFFSLGFPLVLLALLSVINSAIPPEAKNTMFQIKNLAPGLAMFGSVFMALFAGMLLSKDRTSSFLTRLFTSPYDCNRFYYRLYFSYDNYDYCPSFNNLIGSRDLWS